MNKKRNEKREGSLTIRAFVVYLCVVLASIGIFYRIIDLQFVQKKELISQSEAAKKTSEKVELPAERGIIFSCKNEVLVQRAPKYKIAMDTYPIERVKKDGKVVDSIILLPDSVFYANVGALGDSLTKLFGKTTPSWEENLKAARKDKKRYFVLCDKAGISEYLQVQKFPILRDQRKYNALCKVETYLDKPILPYGDLASRTLGYVKRDTTRNQDSIRLVGLEGYYDSILMGKSGYAFRKYISNIAVDVKSGENKPPCDGYNVVTTLDMTFQDIASSALENSLREFNADEGCVIIMKVETGDVLAIANLSKDKYGKYRETKNIALTDYEPGSTFKTASLLVALDDGKVTPNTQIPMNYTSGRTSKVGHRNVTDDHTLAVSNPELWYIFSQSSNVGTTRAIYNSYATQQQQFIDGLYKLGFGDTLRFPIAGGDKKPLLRSTSHPRWSKMSISTIPMGYELQVTPLHLLTFYNAIANNGCMVAPRLVTKLFSKDTTILRGVDTLNAHICSNQALSYMQSMLDSVVSCGTGRRGFVGVPYKVAGKTGTSKIYSPDAKGESLYNASFCGYFPADNPKYSCIVVIKKPRTKSIYGGAVALPVFRNIADKIYATDYDLMAEVETSPQNVFAMPVSANLTFVKNIIPDVIGMSLTDALYILEKAGMTTEVKGYGRVKRQTPEANSPLQGDKKVILELDIES